MSVNHSVSDLVAMIRNGYLARRREIFSPVSILRGSILSILKDEGYILGYSKSPDSRTFSIYLKYYISKPVINEISVVSKPGKRVYRGAKDIPSVKNGLGVVIISTSKGVMSDSFARASKVGGEILLKVF